MILADENIDFSIIESLRTSGYSVISVAESFSGISDEEIINLSRNPPQIILTEDKDFGEWVFAHHISDISVILIRYQYHETKEITRALKHLLETKLNTLQSSFTVLTKSKVRIRTLFG